MDENKQFDSSFNYQKVYSKGVVTNNIASTGGGPPPTPVEISIPHSLGKITSFRAWYDPAIGSRIPVTGNLTSPFTSSSVNYITMNAYMTTTNLVFSILNLSGGTVNNVKIYYRIYYDAY